MPNSGISDLSSLNANSVTNTDSLFFFGINNGASRLISASVLGTILGTQLGTTVHVTSADVPIAVQSFDTVAPYTVAIDKATYDTLGGFNPNTPGIITTTFEGWVQCFAGVGFLTTSISQEAIYRARVLKNGVQTIGYADVMERVLYNVSQDFQSATTFWSAPMTCAIGDEFSLNVGHETDSVAYRANGDTFLSIRPLSIIVGS